MHHPLKLSHTLLHLKHEKTPSKSTVSLKGVNLEFDSHIASIADLTDDLVFQSFAQYSMLTSVSTNNAEVLKIQALRHNRYITIFFLRF